MLPLITLVAVTTFATASAIRLSRSGPRRRVGKKSSEATRQTPLATASSFEVLAHEMEAEENIILATEEVPLDNRYGNKVLVSEHDISRSAVESIELESGQQLDSLSRFNFFTAMKADLQNRLSRDLDVEIGSQLSRHVRVRFAAAPGEKVCYRLTWKQNNRRGLFQVAVGKKIHRLPYMVTYGLSHTVESIAVEREEV